MSADARVVVFLLILGACHASERRSPPLVEAHDSAGVRVVRVPSLHGLDLTEWTGRKIYSTAALNGGPVDLYNVTAALFAADGSLWLANSGAAEVVIISPEGGLARRVGRKGDGPGEFRDLEALLRDPNGGVIAFDGRLSWFTDDGGFLETRRFDPPNPVVSVRPVVRLPNGDMMAVLSHQNFFQAEGERRDTVPLMLVHDDQVDTLGLWMGLERAFTSAGRVAALVPIGFARTVYYATNGTRFVIGSNDSLDLTVYDVSPSPILRILGSDSPRRVSERDTKRWRNDILKRLEGRLAGRKEADFLLTAWRDAPVRGTLPVFEGLAMDPHNRVWVGEYVLDSDDRWWVVFDSMGVPVARARLPAIGRRPYPGASELLAIGTGRLAVLRRTKLDEEYVEVWSVSGISR